MFHVPNNNRVKIGPMKSDVKSGNTGAFKIPNSDKTLNFFVIASDGFGWEHVSVSLLSNQNQKINRCPTWEEMCFIKNIFWDKEDWVLQYHPEEKDYVNLHKYVLHLWRPIGVSIPKPPTFLTGFVK